MYNFSLYTYLRIVFIISLFSIISAFFIEHILGHKPCNLCLMQRIPYATSIILIAFIHLTKKNEKFFIILLCLTFFFSFTLSFYHFGIEQGFFEESSVCKLKNTFEIISKEELLKQLQVKAVNCKDVTFRIFGFSLTTFNMILSLIIVISSIKIILNYEKFKN